MKNLLHKKDGRKSIKYTWFISYMLILAVPLTTGFWLYWQMQERVNEERLVQAQLKTESIIQTVESEVMKSATIVSYFRHNDVMQEAISRAKETLEGKHALYAQLASVITQYSQDYNISENIYFYFEYDDVIVSSAGAQMPFEFFKSNYKNSDMDFSGWKSSLNKNTDVIYSIYAITIKGENSDTYQSSLHMTLLKGQDNSRGVVVVENSNRVFSAKPSYKEAGFSYMIFDKAGEMVYSSTGKKIRYAVFKNPQTGMVRIDGKKYLINRETSLGTGYTYVVAVDYYEVLKTPQYFYLHFFLIAFSAVLSLILLWYVVRYNYTFVDKIMAFLSKNKGVQDSVGKNELEFINHMILKIDNENFRYNKLISEQNVQLKANYLSRLLRGAVNEVTSIQDGIRKVNNIEFLSDYFAVVVLFVEDYTRFFEDDDRLNEQERINTIRFAIKNIGEEMFAHQGNAAYMADMEEIPTLIVTFSPSNVENADQQLQSCCNELQSFLKDQLSISITVSVSNVHKSIYGIKIAYDEAAKMMEYKFVMGEGSLILPEVIAENLDETYTYTLDREQSLISYIKTGNSSQAIRFIEKLFDHADTANIRLIQCLCMDITATLIKLSGRITNISVSEILEKVQEQKTINTMKKAICDIIQDMCSSLEHTEEESLEQRVVIFLKSNYMRQDLSIVLIAEHLKMHYIYLSNTFKSQVGIGLLEYINRFRINKSSVLLQNTNKTIEEISALVGFGSPKTYTRVFKQYTGQTPSKFRARL